MIVYSKSQLSKDMIEVASDVADFFGDSETGRSWLSGNLLITLKKRSTAKWPLCNAVLWVEVLSGDALVEARRCSTS